MTHATPETHAPDGPTEPRRHDHEPDHGDHDVHAGDAGHGGHDKHAGHDPEMFRRRFWLSLVLTIPLVVTSEMVMDWFGYSLEFRGMSLIGPLLGSIVFWWGGWPFLAGGVAEVRDRQPGMMLLISMAITVAYVASMATSVDWFDLDFWWELAALVTIMLLGHWQEMKAIGQAQGALAALAELLPDDAERVADGGEVERVSIADLGLGDVVLVRSGARVPADGEIVDGRAELDESMITGESRPVAKSPGDRVVAGTVSTDSAIRVRVDAVGDDTTLAGIQRLVAEAQASSSRAQVLADRFAAMLFYVAAMAGLVTLLVWWGLGDADNAIVRTVTVLVIACPHALGLAIPLVIALSTAVSAKAGILVKDRLALERMRTVDAVLFDKTGTLTRGAHVVTGVVAADGVSEDEVLRIAGGVESDSEHPLARAIVTAARERGEVAAAGDFRSLTGRGVEATVDGTTYAVGGPALLRERGATVPDGMAHVLEGWRDRGAAVLHLVADGQVVGAFELEDEIRPEARQAVADLQAEGLKVVMITGDARQ
ncbi:MAG TPA: heavy metal translocating P-type ATPase, partial [Acidimicrobiales bacterium]